MVSGDAWTIVVTPDLEFLAEFDIEHYELMDPDIPTEDYLRARYWPESNLLWFTWPNYPQDFHTGGMFEDHFNVLYSNLSENFPQFGLRTEVDWRAGVSGRRETLGKVLAPIRRRPIFRRPVRVRPYRRRR